MLDLEPIKARLAVATPGPWHVEPEATACGSFVARMPGIYIEPEHQHLAPAGNDAALIANAPADIAALVAEVERLTKDNERLMAKLDAACEMGQDSIKRGAEARAENKRLREALEPFAALLSDELYENLTGRRVWQDEWPEADPEMLRSDTVTIVVQVNGKLRDRIEVAEGTDEAEVLALAKAAENVAKNLEGFEIVKEIYVPGKLVNLAVRPA